MLQGQFDGGLKKPLFATTIVALAVVLVSVNTLFGHQTRDGVGELDFAASTWGLVANLIEDARREDVAAGDAHARRRIGRLGLFDDALDADQAFAGGWPRHNAVAADLILRHFLHGQYRSAQRFVGARHLRQHRRAARGAHHQVIGQQHGERLVAHDM